LLGGGPVCRYCIQQMAGVPYSHRIIACAS
jgi:hypothetical protein